MKGLKKQIRRLFKVQQILTIEFIMNELNIDDFDKPDVEDALDDMSINYLGDGLKGKFDKFSGKFELDYMDSYLEKEERGKQ